MLFYIAEGAEFVFAAAPVFFYFYEEFEVDFLAEEFFYVFTGVDAYLFYFFAAFAYEDCFLACLLYTSDAADE